jgi:U3 small nucleolar RNA-associated protein 5
MNLEHAHLKCFSPNQKLFSYIDSDGKLKIWDVESNELKQEYTPNLHLSTPCTTLIWIEVNTNAKV